LQLGRQAYVALEDSGQVHVTPVLYAWADGRLWFAAGAATRKVHLLQNSSTVGVLVEAGSRHVLIAGAAEVIDPARPLSLVGSPREVTRRAGGLGLYGLRNVVDLAGFARDTVMLRNGRLRPRRRVFVGVRPHASAVFDGERLGGLWGQWPQESPPSSGPASPSSGAGAVLGWMTDASPVALPIRWDAGRSSASLDRAAVDGLGLSRWSPACVVVDDYGGPGPSPKRGTAVRGFGELIDDEQGMWAHVEPERVSHWSGATSHSRRITAS
jgi:hypothetical protein